MKSLRAKLILWGVVVSVLGVGLSAFLLSEISLYRIEEAYYSEARAIAHGLLEVFNAIGTTNLGIAKVFASSDIVNEGLKLGAEAGKGIAAFKIERLINPIFEKMKKEGIDFVIVFNDQGEWVYEAGLGLKDQVVPEAQIALSVLSSKGDQKTIFKGLKGMEVLGCSYVGAGGVVMVGTVLSNELLDKMKGTERFDMSLFDIAGGRVATTLLSKGERVKTPIPDEAREKVLVAGEEFLKLMEVAGALRFVGGVPLKHASGMVLGALGCAIPADAYLDARKALMERALIVGGALIVLGVVIFFFVSSGISRRVNRVKEALTSLASGDLSINLPSLG
ncbi:MAG: cache domain-containing protein, partial [Synergistetes bacterium]|nr:cache domain-containing protein [Synergistota bacterium]